MTTKISRLLPLLIVLFILGIALVGCNKSSSPKPSSQQKPQPPKLHPWWNLSEEEGMKYFEEGKEVKRKGADFTTLIKGRILDKPIDKDITVFFVDLWAPPQKLKIEGYWSEHDLLPMKDCDEVFNKIFRITKNGIHYSVNLTCHNNLENLDTASFILENDSGEREAPRRKNAPEITVGHGTNSSWFTGNYDIPFPLNQDAPFVTENTKWLRLWIITTQKRLPVTFWIDGSDKIEVGKPQ